MRLKRLFMKNFLCVGEDPVEIAFSDDGGLTVIRGVNHDVSCTKASNAAGKSTIIEGILFAFYGEVLRTLTLPTIPNSNTKGDCVVELEYDEVSISRTLARKKKKVEHHIKFTVNGEQQGTNASVIEVQKEIQRVVGVNFKTMCNILIFGQHNMVSFLDAGEPEKREIIESLMNLAEYNAFEQRAKDAARETKTEIKVLSEAHSLHMRHLGEQIALKAKQEKLLDEFRTALDAEITEINDRIVGTPSIEFVKKEWERYNDNATKKAACEKQISELQEQRVAVSEKLAELTKDKQDELNLSKHLEEHHNNLRAKYSVLAQRKDQVIKDKTGWIDEKLAILRDEINQLTLIRDRELVKVQPSQNWQALISTASRQVKEAENKLDTLESLKAKFDTSLNENESGEETCPTCFGKIDPRNIAGVINTQNAILQDCKNAEQKLIDQKKAEEAEIKAKVEGIQNQCREQFQIRAKEIETNEHLKKTVLDEINQQAEEAETKIGEQIEAAASKLAAYKDEVEKKYAPHLDKLNNEQQTAIAELGKLNRELFQLNTAKKPDVSLEQLAEIGAKLEADKKLLTEKKRARKSNPYAEIIKSLDESIAQADKEAKGAETSLKEKEKLLPYYEWWVTHFGKQGIKSYVIDQIIPTLNEQIEYWMQIIYQGAISVRFDKFLNVTMVNNASKNEMIFGQGSGGERRRIDLAIMLAFRQIMQLSTGRNPNVLFFDEVAENLDEDGVYRLYDTLVEIGKTSRVFVITHNPTLLSLLGSAGQISVEKRGGVMTLSR